MIDPITLRRVMYWGLFCILSAGIIFIRLLPLDLNPGRWPGADWSLVLGFAWVLRRPRFMPALLFAAVMLLNDFLLLRPPGLWAALGLIGLEFLRGRSQFTREQPFLLEWTMVAAVIISMGLVNRLIQGMFVIGQPAMAVDILYFLMTALAYPVAVLLSSLLLGVRQLPPGAVDEYGHRI